MISGWSSRGIWTCSPLIPGFSRRAKRLQADQHRAESPLVVLTEFVLVR